MVEYRMARAEEAADILDFINYVFSQAHRPHDFKKFNPPMYDSDYPFWKEHYVAVENGRIKATLSVTQKEAECAGTTLTYGYIGQVSVHPYERGAGHMKRLMQMVDETALKLDYDFCKLGGLRQRYGYFGYTQGDPHYEMAVTTTNTRHALRGRECALTAKQRHFEGGWNYRYDLVNEAGKCVGIIGNNTMELDDLSLVADACEAFFRASGEKEYLLTAELHDTERIRAINAMCEWIKLANHSMYKIYHFDRFLKALLCKRAQYSPMANGELKLDIEGQALCLQVENGKVQVLPGTNGEGLQLTRYQAQEMLFSPATRALYPETPLGWFPASI